MFVQPAPVSKGLGTQASEHGPLHELHPDRPARCSLARRPSLASSRTQRPRHGPSLRPIFVGEAVDVRPPTRFLSANSEARPYQHTIVAAGSKSNPTTKWSPANAILGGTLRVRVGFIGAGSMATAIMQGLLSAGMSEASNIKASATGKGDSLNRISGLKVQTTTDNSLLVAGSDIIVLCVKPAAMEGVLNEIRGVCTTEKLVVSVAAGVRNSWIQTRLSPGVRVVRVMPNLACSISRSATAVSAGLYATEADSQLVCDIFASLGSVHLVPERAVRRMMDAVTALSGSGPAFAAIMIEALADGGVAGGLPRDVAEEMAVQTVLGVADMLSEGAVQHPALVKDAAASPAGTTIAGIRALERSGFRSAVIEAVIAATERAREISRE